MADITAALCIIGDEILSGRTKDKNIGHLADVMTLAGIDLREVRIVSDNQADIVDAVNALRVRYTYVFTSGGIGPTHDDITADAIAAAFDVPIDVDDRAKAILAEYYKEIGREFNDSRMRMTRIPKGADLIENRVSAAPGFILGNVYVMAGVPSIFAAMLDAVLLSLQKGRPVLSHSVHYAGGESDIAHSLADFQDRYPDIMIGSYPRLGAGGFSVEIVLRSRNEAELTKVAAELKNVLDARKVIPDVSA
jgi:molybdenum cofactor synthesis domain-containing protein